MRELVVSKLIAVVSSIVRFNDVVVISEVL